MEKADKNHLIFIGLTLSEPDTVQYKGELYSIGFAFKQFFMCQVKF